MDTRNRQFYSLVDAANALMFTAGEIAGLYREALQDGITAYREERIKNLTKYTIPNLNAKLRDGVRPRPLRIKSECPTCGHKEWED